VPHLANHFKAYGQPFHTLTQNNANNLPKSSNGEELCLSFHLQGQCFHACKCCKTHQKLQLLKEESIVTFLDKCNVPPLWQDQRPEPCMLGWQLPCPPKPKLALCPQPV
jgi:hypothetical protein